MELQISNTREELLLNTINHFNNYNKGIDSSGLGTYCNAYNRNRRCAIGREIPEELAVNSFGSIYNIYDKLPERLKKMGIEFLRDIQFLHDSGIYWDDDGLSESGRNQAIRIIKGYNLDLKL